MSDLIIPDVGSRLANLFERMAELERRVLALGDDPPGEEGCCTVLCCNDNPGVDLTVGASQDFCAVTLEETAGVALRLAINGFVTIRTSPGGQIIFDAGAVVAAQAYLERSRWDMTMAANGMTTVPVVATIDTPVAAPSVAIRVRNLNTPTFTVTNVVLQVLVYGVRDGSTACGESAGTS